MNLKLLTAFLLIGLVNAKATSKSVEDSDEKAKTSEIESVEAPNDAKAEESKSVENVDDAKVEDDKSAGSKEKAEVKVQPDKIEANETKETPQGRSSWLRLDRCLQPKPKESKSKDAHYWFYFNDETRRCEVFAYDGEVTERSRNRFEFFDDCHEECSYIMEGQEKIAINDLYIKDEKKCKVDLSMPCEGDWGPCPSDRDHYILDPKNIECKKTKYCCNSGRNTFKSLNECRKTCFYGMDSNEGKSSKCIGGFASCKMGCSPGEGEIIFFYSNEKKQCVRTESCCPMGGHFKSMNDCKKKCH